MFLIGGGGGGGGGDDIRNSLVKSFAYANMCTCMYIYISICGHRKQFTVECFNAI